MPRIGMTILKILIGITQLNDFTLTLTLSLEGEGIAGNALNWVSLILILTIAASKDLAMSGLFSFPSFRRKPESRKA